jgi:hypothetical protein
MSDTWVLSFTHLNDRPKADDALVMLQRVASLVKPIMRKHTWKLPVLAEFFPDQANLLGAPRICCRVRLNATHRASG